MGAGLTRRPECQLCNSLLLLAVAVAPTPGASVSALGVVAAIVLISGILIAGTASARLVLRNTAAAMANFPCRAGRIGVAVLGSIAGAATIAARHAAAVAIPLAARAAIPAETGTASIVPVIAVAGIVVVSGTAIAGAAIVVA